MASPRKEDVAANPVYGLIARRSLWDMHSYMLRSLFDFFNNKPGKNKGHGKHTLVIAGHGPEVVPFSRHLDIVEQMIGNGNIAMFDYNPDIIKGSIEALLKPKFESDEVVPDSKRKGISERGYIIYDSYPSDEIINLQTIGNKKVIIRQGNLRDTFKFEDNSVSAFEATLSIHHVTAYTQGIYHVIDEAYRILEKGGLFHWGDAVVNMRYQEEKIHNIAKDVLELLSSPASVLGHEQPDYKQVNGLVIIDRRDPDKDKSVENAEIQHVAFYQKGVDYKSVPLVPREEYEKIKDHEQIREYEQSLLNKSNSIIMEIRKDGMVEITIPRDDKIVQNTSTIHDNYKCELFLKDKGYKQVYATGNKIIMPLIDHGMQADREQFIDSVNNYYQGIKRVLSTDFADKPDIAASALSATEKEHGDALRGLFEYYTQPEIIVGLLQERGFRNVHYRPDKHNVWCNITAIK